MIRRSPAVDDAMGANEGRAPRKCPRRTWQSTAKQARWEERLMEPTEHNNE